MGLTEKIALGLLCAFVLLGVIQLFSAPLKLALKVLVNTLLGFVALFLLNLASSLTGFSLGMNLFNALVIGVLGVPGLVLLVLLKLVFV
ncbi:MAG: Pro-sigmaK processing inhibitor BofA [Ruminococcaceae bacterium]|jgi:inhibitor of the pro-sigma K processing machinery|nr:Pro-sigmaK processing inhibitor BofA [Oscillospiraceae bacterium]